MLSSVRLKSNLNEEAFNLFIFFVSCIFHIKYMRKQEVSELATLKEIEKNYDKIRVDDILSYRSHAEQKHIDASQEMY